MDREPAIEDAILLAARAHRGQVDKAGEPYILHPLRVMLRLKVLHDVIEDTGITEESLRDQGYSEEVLGALDALTRRQGESYADFIERVAGNPLARRVKLADLADNLDASRLLEITPKDRERLARYQAAWERLSSE
jgi:(p)ppGpp synthase/HD superfamily hydrolase